MTPPLRLSLEAVARVLCADTGLDPEGPEDSDAAEPNWTLFRAEAAARLGVNRDDR